MLAYDIMIFGDSPPPCPSLDNLFTNDIIDIFNYAETIRKYALYGPKHEETTRMAKPYIEALLKRLEPRTLKTKQVEQPKGAHFSFSVDTTLLPVMSIISPSPDVGGYKKGHVWKEVEFKPSMLVPHGGSYSIILYDEGNGPMVMLSLHGHVYKVKGFPMSFLDFKNLLRKYLDLPLLKEDTTSGKGDKKSVNIETGKGGTYGSAIMCFVSIIVHL